jgi:hypothetical protein
MRHTKDEIPAVSMGGYVGHQVDEGDLRIAFESMPADFPGREFFRGLPDDRCQCHHHGYVIKGSFRVDYPDGTEEIVREGEAYVLNPGHYVHTLEPCELIEFSPAADHDITMAAIERNVAALSAS